MVERPKLRQLINELISNNPQLEVSDVLVGLVGDDVLTIEYIHVTGESASIRSWGWGSSTRELLEKFEDEVERIVNNESCCS
jgi:hypothetical protein